MPLSPCALASMGSNGSISFEMSVTSKEYGLFGTSVLLFSFIVTLTLQVLPLISTAAYMTCIRAFLSLGLSFVLTSLTLPKLGCVSAIIPSRMTSGNTLRTA